MTEYVLWTVEDRYQDSLLKRVNDSETDDFLRHSSFQYDASLDEDESKIGSDEPSRVLKFIKSTDDFYDWFEFIIDDLYGPGLDREY